MNDRTQQVKERAREIGFHAVGIAAIDPITTHTAAQHLQEWLALGYQADMAWMSDARRQDIYRLMPDAKTVIAVALNYYTPHQRPDSPNHAKIARYAWGRDYHKVLTKKLKQLTNWLTQSFDNVEARYYVDTGPIQDKFWAQAAGIGWIGKNGNVINRQYGSWIFLGEIVTNIPLIPSDPHTNTAAHVRAVSRLVRLAQLPNLLWSMPIDVLLTIRSRIVPKSYHQKSRKIRKDGSQVVIFVKMFVRGIKHLLSLQM